VLATVLGCVGLLIRGRGRHCMHAVRRWFRMALAWGACMLDCFVVGAACTAHALKRDLSAPFSRCEVVAVHRVEQPDHHQVEPVVELDCCFPAEGVEGWRGGGRGDQGARGQRCQGSRPHSRVQSRRLGMNQRLLAVTNAPGSHARGCTSRNMMARGGDGRSSGLRKNAQTHSCRCRERGSSTLTSLLCSAADAGLVSAQSLLLNAVSCKSVCGGLSRGPRTRGNLQVPVAPKQRPSASTLYIMQKG